MIEKLLDDRYQILEKIGSGGMADVYRARDVLLDRVVAVKILHSAFVDDNDFIARFRHEAQSAGKLSHPNIVGIYDVGCDQGMHYIVMEYVEGKTLKQYIQGHAGIPVDTAVRIAIEIGEALEEAHKNGIIHCDIKPHNILLTESGRVKVTDFGIARAVNSSTILNRESILGSVHYLSPEQAAGDKVTEKTDIYSLGIVLYEMLTGHLPFDGDTAVGIALKHIQNDIPSPTRYNPAISPMLEECLLTALRRDPEKRYATVADFVSELKIAQGFTTSVYKPAQPEFAVASAGGRASLDNQPRESRLAVLVRRLSTKYLWVLMALLFLTAFLWAFFSFGNFWSSTEISVPNVVGKPVSQAEELLKKKNLRVSLDEIVSDTVPVGMVISQTPPADSSVKEQRIIHLSVSKGGSVLNLPDFSGMTLEQAKEQLLRLGFKIGAVETADDASKASDTVISQTPSAGSPVTKGSSVNLVINAKQIDVPDLSGMTLEEAQKALTAIHMGIGKISVENSSIKPDSPGAVVTAQVPAAGSRTAKDGKVDVTVGRNPSGTEKKGTVNVALPKEGKARHVEILVIDDTGKQVVYSREAEPGTTIVKDVSGWGEVRVQVLVDNSVVQDRSL